MFGYLMNDLKKDIGEEASKWKQVASAVAIEARDHIAKEACDAFSEAGRLARSAAVTATGSDPGEVYVRAKNKMVDQMDQALANSDSSSINQLLDNAMARSLLGPSAPAVVRKAAQQSARRQLREAIDSEDPKRIKGALIAAKRLNAVDIPEFNEASDKYKEVRKLPIGWDVSAMVLRREGARMVAKLELDSPAVLARFQRLLDLTHRKVYTRDRAGQPVPERLQLLSVAAVTNDDLWEGYVTRREAIRQELEADSSDFVPHEVETVASSTGDASLDGAGESAASIAASLADDFAMPLMPRVNEVFLFHGTSAAAAEKIMTHDFRINLAGSNAGTLYGRGLYLAENGSKSDEYSTPLKDGVRHMLMCRAVLGRVFYTDAKDSKPRECEDACLKSRYHSVLGDRKKCRGTFREFVVFDEEQVYTNYILTYRRIDRTSKFFDCVCPPDATPGAVIQATTPDGQVVHGQVPVGVSPGQNFPMQYTPKAT